MTTAHTDVDSAGAVTVSPGELFGGKYRIVRALAAGGMGAVFEARHEQLGKTVAIKVLRAELARDERFATRFLHEAKIATELHHRNIVEIHDFGVDEGRPYMVMEFLRGETLASLMDREGTLSPIQLAQLLDPILRALSSAHERGIVHRDLKPENIFLVDEAGSEGPVPKVLDFGIAKRAPTGDVRLTDTHSSLGTPAYMAPEQAMGARDVTAAADQYAIGVILYEALSGTLPHRGENYNEMIVSKVTTPARRLSEAVPSIEPALEKIVMRALATSPNARFPSLVALRDALAPFRESRPSRRPLATAPTIAGPIDTQLDGTSIQAAARDHVDTMGATIAAIDTGSFTQPPPAQNEPMHDVPIEPSRVEPVASWKQGPFWAGASIAALAVVALGVFAFRSRSTSAPVAPVVVAPHATDAPRAAEPVVLRIHVEPPTAVITLDGTVVGHGEAEITRARDGHRYQVALSAPGYVDASYVVVADADMRIDRVLQAIPSAPVATAPTQTASAHHTIAASTAPQPAPTEHHGPHIDRQNPF